MIVAIALLSACFFGAPCASNAQCGGTGQCVPGGGGYGCGAYQSDYECGDSGGCDTASVCQEFLEACGEGARCVPACDSDEGCGATERCDPASRTCVTRSCTDPAITCAVLTHCDEASGACVADTCVIKNDCVDGFCVNGTCAGEPGQCSGALP